MRNTKAKRIRNYLETKGLEYVSCKKQEKQYEVMAYNPVSDNYVRYMVVFADTMIIIQTMEMGTIQFMAEGETVALMEIVEG